MHRSFHLLLLLVAFLVAATARAQDNATPSTIVVKKTTTTSTTPRLSPIKDSPKACLLAYYSSKSMSVSPKRARALHQQAVDAVNSAKKPIKDGGLGLCGGFRDIEDESLWKDFVSNCIDREAEAEAYRPLIRRGCVVLVLTDVDEKKWFYGPVLLNGAMDGAPQVVFMVSEHERLAKPKLASEQESKTSATKTKQTEPTTVVASTAADSPAAAVTGNGNQK